MKKTMLPLLALMVSCSVLHAQVHIGIKGGMNIATFTGGSTIATHAYVGYNAGGLANINVTKRFSVQPEVMYSDEGVKFHPSNNQDIRWKDHLNYLNIPLLAKYSVKGFYGETGPQLGFLLSSKDDLFQDGVHGTLSSTQDHRKNIFSWTVGAGYQTPFRPGIDARYNLSISKAYTESAGVPTGTSVRSNVFQAGIFYMW